MKKNPRAEQGKGKRAGYARGAAFRAARNPGTGEGTPRRRILEAAMRLFYRRGYGETSVDQILAEAGAYKKSFYRYYASREELGLEYLNEQAAFFFGFLEDIKARYSDFDSFLKAWMRVLRRDVRDGLFTNCPFAALASQITEEDEAFRAALRDIVKRRRKVLTEYLKECAFEGRKPSADFPAVELAERIITMYQGAVALFNLSGDTSSIRRLEGDIRFLARASLGGYE